MDYFTLKWIHILSSTLLTLLVLPVLYRWLQGLDTSSALP